MLEPKKALGQHWLYDEQALNMVADAADIGATDTVLEIGPGLGTLTEVLLERAAKVIAVEADPELVMTLTANLASPKLEIIGADIREFDLRSLPTGYKVAANIPYYLTSHLIRLLLESANPPASLGLLVQKEVAERIVAEPGKMSVLAVGVQYLAEASTEGVVSKDLFTPPPKVDSAVLRLIRRPKPYFEADTKRFFSLVKAGFSEKRKQLKNALAGSLRVPVAEAATYLKQANIKETARAQELALEDWQRLYQIVTSK